MHKSWLSPKVNVQWSSIHCRGIIAISAIIKGERVLVWGGSGYTNKDGITARQMEHGRFMQWDDDVFSIESGESDECFMINHACDPNVWMTDAFTLCARRNIEIGEEITADYALWEHRDNAILPWKCCCGSPLCRGRVTGSDWKDPVLQERYRGHFSPLLNKRIESEKLLKTNHSGLVIGQIGFHGFA
jgi:hypothetical protein